MIDVILGIVILSSTSPMNRATCLLSKQSKAVLCFDFPSGGL